MLKEWYADTENVYIITDVCDGGELFDLVKARITCAASLCVRQPASRLPVDLHNVLRLACFAVRS